MATEWELRAAEQARVVAVQAAKTAVAKRDGVIRALLKGGWTMAEVAEVLGVSRSYVNEIHKRGRRNDTRRT